MIVLDASAVLALLQDEPGADVVQQSLRGSLISTANLAEVVGKLVDADIDARPLTRRLLAAGVGLEPLNRADAELAGALRSVAGGSALSLGDRCCLALALRTVDAVVLTADRAWVDLDLPLDLRLIR